MGHGLPNLVQQISIEPPTHDPAFYRFYGFSHEFPIDSMGSMDFPMNFLDLPPFISPLSLRAFRGQAIYAWCEEMGAATLEEVPQ